MVKVISTERIPIKMWLDAIDPEAEIQAKNLANLPFAFSHIAIMPDCHEGYGMPIGGVLATTDAIIPNAVGVDIGCGMNSVRTSLTTIEKGALKRIIELIRDVVPLGFRHHSIKQDESLMPSIQNIDEMTIIRQEYESALYQLGTLGGGNHFIEIQEGSDGFIWIMVHSGSRNLGKKVAEYYNNIAKMLNRMWFSCIEKSTDLAFLPEGSAEAVQYFTEMTYCQQFAAANRQLIMQNITGCFISVLGEQVSFDKPADVAHNYARYESHFGTEVIVHRKGATSAKKGETGIIPGSQGSLSFIVSGLGNPESFMSCAHGAGRKMSRHKAQKSLSLKDEIEMMNRKGIIHGIRSTRDLDEAPGAYKDINEVMGDQKDLVEVVVRLTPLAVIKG